MKTQNFGFGAIVCALLATSATAQDVPLDILVDQPDAGPASTDVNRSRDVVLADLDGDGDNDMLVANRDEDNALYWNDGSGMFTRETVGPLVNDGGDSRGIALADVDGDADLDVFIANASSQANALYVNQGGVQGGTQGTFVKLASGDLTLDTDRSKHARFADIDGDTDLDLFVANWLNEDNDLYINESNPATGDVVFTQRLVGEEVSQGGMSYDAGFADIDGDNDMDLFVSNHSGIVGVLPNGSVNYLYTNNGSGIFTRVTTGLVTTDIGNSLCAAFADFDNDGDQDLYVGQDEGQKNLLYENDGAGNFSAFDSPLLTADRGESIGCAIADLNDDGLIDIVVANRKGQLINEFNGMYFNTGDVTFRRQAFGPLNEQGGETYDFAIGDINGDLVPDVVGVNFAEANYVYRNNGRQWEDQGLALAGVSGMPLLGGRGNFQPTEMVDVTVDAAAPNAAAFMVLGLTASFVPFKGGTLVPTPDSLFSGLATDASGELLLKGKTPNGLPPGLEFFLQSWIDDAAAPAGLSATNGLRIRAP